MFNLFSYLHVNTENGLCFVRLTMDASQLSCCDCGLMNVFICFNPRGSAERIPGILPCSRQCWRRTEMEARGARRIQVCVKSGRKTARIQESDTPNTKTLKLHSEFINSFLTKLYEVPFTDCLLVKDWECDNRSELSELKRTEEKAKSEVCSWQIYKTDGGGEKNNFFHLTYKKNKTNQCFISRYL